MKTFLRTATVTSATLALLAGTAVTGAHAEEAPTPAAATTAAEQGTLNAWFQPGDVAKTSNGLFILINMGIEGGPDGSIQGAGGVPNYDLNKLFLELTNKYGGPAVRANAFEAIGTVPLNEYDPLQAIGAWDSSDESVLSVAPNGGLTVGKDGAATITFLPSFIENNTVVYGETPLTIDLQVKDGQVTAAPAPEQPAPEQPAPEQPVVEQPAPEQPVVAPTDPAAPFVYENCAAVYEAGAAPIREGDYGWHQSLDADGDKVGCEQDPDYTNETTEATDASQNSNNGSSASDQPAQLANTGAEDLVPAATGLALIALGGGALVASRRRSL
ncbi:excalibur calcium-binding domain-containing protein [Rothia nasimurium]|uniref:excalibur calcium-binding domain-containing protein n=1 Tax=Rothia nasimurium TaxID=85336 RepID=UPI001F32EBD9|nr:excalibur calcium-binding domain-containing protein [Rothia nasimurium]